MPSSGSLKIERWFREWGRLYILFMSVGLSAIPVGVVYGFLKITGYDSLWVAGSAIACGLMFGLASWKFVDSKFFGPNQATAPATLIYTSVPEPYFWLNTSGASSEPMQHAFLPSFDDTLDFAGARTAGGMQTAPEEEYACVAS